jgi:hypothetical protein
LVLPMASTSKRAARDQEAGGICIWPGRGGRLVPLDQLPRLRRGGSRRASGQYYMVFVSQRRRARCQSATGALRPPRNVEADGDGGIGRPQ